jgi:hypothetical protein
MYERQNRIPQHPLFNWSPISQLALKDGHILYLEFEDGLKEDFDANPLILKGGFLRN